MPAAWWKPQRKALKRVNAFRVWFCFFDFQDKTLLFSAFPIFFTLICMFSFSQMLTVFFFFFEKKQEQETNA